MAKAKFKRRLKILFVTSELYPFAKNGGLADVVGHLPKTLAKDFQIEIRIVLPKYKVIDLEKIGAKHIVNSVKVLLPDNRTWKKISIWKTYLPETTIPVYLVDCPEFLPGTGDLYLQGTPKQFEGLPFFHLVFLSKVALELIKIQDWQPDVIHYHDGYEAMIAKWLKTIHKDDPLYRDTANVLTIHNLSAQPNAKLAAAKKVGLKRRDFKESRKYTNPGYVNFTAEAILDADMINTVSPTYAKEVLTKKRGSGLHTLLRSRKSRFTGILNGIDYSDFDPRTNDDTPVKYWLDNLDKKVENKLYLQKKFGLTESAELPLICAVSRLTPQKGLDLIEDVLKDLLDMGAQFVVLGSGDKNIEKIFIKAEKQHPKAIAAEMQFDAHFAQTIYAGSDMLLMPSRFEPCGLSQIIAMRFGTIPIVRKTGGLADTVRDGFTGFVFKDYEKKAFLDAISRAVDIYYNQKDHWKKMQIKAMKKDFSWKASAKKYIWLYKKAIRFHREETKKADNA